MVFIQCINTAYRQICLKTFFIIYDVLPKIMLDNDLKSREEIQVYVSVCVFSYVYIHTFSKAVSQPEVNIKNKNQLLQFVVAGLAWSNDPESYMVGSVTCGKVSHSRQVKGDNPVKWDTLVLQVGS